MKYYPVIITTINRYNHLKDCIESLSRCKFANYTDLIIGLDYPPSKEYQKGYEQIKKYVPTISGFNKVIVFYRDHNLGAKENYLSLVKYVETKYDAFIASEDDNVFAPNFLEFMNSALLQFKDNSNIFSICGYTHMNQYNKNVDYLMTKDNSEWGIARWKYKKIHIERDFVKRIVFSTKLSWKIFRNYPMCLHTLIQMYRMGDWYGDTVITAHNIIYGNDQIRPSESLVRNMGHDGSGLHCGASNHGFESQKLSNRDCYVINEDSSQGRISACKFFFQGFYGNRIRNLISIAMIWVRYLKFRKTHCKD